VDAAPENTCEAAMVAESSSQRVETCVRLEVMLVITGMSWYSGFFMCTD
jgi:hypothetical protein